MRYVSFALPGRAESVPSAGRPSGDRNFHCTLACKWLNQLAESWTRLPRWSRGNWPRKARKSTKRDRQTRTSPNSNILIFLCLFVFFVAINELNWLALLNRKNLLDIPAQYAATQVHGSRLGPAAFD